MYRYPGLSLNPGIPISRVLNPFLDFFLPQFVGFGSSWANLNSATGGPDPNLGQNLTPNKPSCSGVFSKSARCSAVAFWGQNTPRWLRGEVERLGIGIPWLYACRRGIRHSKQEMGCEVQGWTGFSSNANGLHLVPFGSLPINQDRTVGAHHSIHQEGGVCMCEKCPLSRDSVRLSRDMALFRFQPA